jgi:hypothetical protein
MMKSRLKGQKVGWSRPESVINSIFSANLGFMVKKMLFLRQ